MWHICMEIAFLQFPQCCSENFVRLPDQRTFCSWKMPKWDTREEMKSQRNRNEWSFIWSMKTEYKWKYAVQHILLTLVWFPCNNLKSETWTTCFSLHQNSTFLWSHLFWWLHPHNDLLKVSCNVCFSRYSFFLLAVNLFCFF